MASWLQRLFIERFDDLWILSRESFEQHLLDKEAEKWEKNEDATQWIFHLRKGVKFHDDPCFSDGQGREVTAKDFLYCFEQLCTSSPENNQFNNTFKDKVVGADEYFQSTIDKKPLEGGVSGIIAVDDYTIQINLLFPFAGFLNILSTPGCWLFPKEAVEKFKKGNEKSFHYIVGQVMKKTRGKLTKDKKKGELILFNDLV